MYMTSLQYFMLICLCCPVVRMPSKEERKDMLQMLEEEKMDKFDNEIFEENKPKFQRIRVEYRIIESPIKKQCSTSQKYSMDFYFIFLYHIMLRKVSTESVLATTALFFWKVSAFPVNCSSRTDRTLETGPRKPRDVSKSTKLNRGDCEESWIQFEEKCYQAFTKIMNYKTASAHCTSLESELAKIQTMRENNFTKDLANYAGISWYLWIAVQKLCWNCTETESGFQHWLPGQPSGVGKCVMMHGVNGQWRDFDCRYMFAFVCEKAVAQNYTERQLLIALVVPICSCLTVAISFTTALLVSSVRRAGKPFKLASRYGRTKRQRKPTNYDMIDILRRASLTRRGSRLKTRPSAPSIEITKAEDTNGTIVGNVETAEKNPWYKRGNAKRTKNLHIPEERRRSSNSSGNSSLYELLARLNRMDFEPQNEASINENGIELQELSGDKNGVRPTTTEDGSKVDEDDKILKADASVNGEANMAFRDSVVSVESNGNGAAKVTSVQQVNQRDSVRKLGDIENVKEVGQGSCDCPRDRSRDESQLDETEAGRNTQTVRADVHNNGNNAAPSSSNESVDKQQRKLPSQGKVIWTYSL